jgi:membrane protein
VTVAGWIERARDFVTVELWRSQPERRSQLGVVRLLQFSIMVVEGFVRDHLLLRASALAYFTVLSVVPLLAVAVSIASAVGVGSRDFVDWVVGTLAAVSPEAQAQIRELVAGANFTGLGTLSAVVLFLTTVFAISNVEKAFNGIWGVAQARGLSRRFSDYLAVLVVAPLLGGVALSLTPTLRSQWLLQRMLDVPVFAELYAFGLSQLPTLMLSLVFAFLYWFLPNTRVRPLSAGLGAVPAAILTVAAQGLFIDLGVGVARASTFFGSFAAFPLLFIWIYVFWAIVLFGAEIAFAHQNLHLYRREVRGEPAGGAEREAMALRIALEVGRRFRLGAPCVDAGDLADSLHAPVRTVRDVADRLVEAGILSLRAEERSDTLQLGRPADTIRVVDVLGALRGEREASAGDPEIAGLVASLMGELEQSALASAGSRTLQSLLRQLSPGEAPDPTDAAGEGSAR